ncbi:MAG: radical SAM protein [Desulfobulbaceae bacterium]|nr:radical SAM protein [Desulfobulbaceae bacterium]
MFKKIFVEITNRCNLDCPFCSAIHRPRADMRSADFALLLPQLAPFTKHLALHVLGEPLLHPELAQLLALCHDQAFQVNLTTNGTLLPRQAQLLLAASALRQVNVSLHSVNARHDGIEPMGYLAGVLQFARLAAARGIFVSLRIWDLPVAKEQVGGRWQETVLHSLEEFFCLPFAIQDSAVPGQGIKLAEKIFLSQKELFAWPTLLGPDVGEKGTCRGLRDQVAILVDGTVVPCCLDAAANIPLGNVFQEQFGEIVAGGRASRIRKGFRERLVVEALCRRCEYRVRFSGKLAGPAGGQR